MYSMTWSPLLRPNSINSMIIYEPPVGSGPNYITQKKKFYMIKSLSWCKCKDKLLILPYKAKELEWIWYRTWHVNQGLLPQTLRAQFLWNKEHFKFNIWSNSANQITILFYISKLVKKIQATHAYLSWQRKNQHQYHNDWQN